MRSLDGVVIGRVVIGRALIGRALIGRALIGRALIGRALIGRALIAPALIARALVHSQHTPSHVIHSLGMCRRNQHLQRPHQTLRASGAWD